MPLRVSAAGEGQVVVAQIDGGKGNALDIEIVDGLLHELRGLTSTQGLVVTGCAGMFTGGLDLSTLAAGGEPADRLLAGMGRLLVGVLRSSRPVVVAADGNGVAAGAMLMLAADLAIVSDRVSNYGFAEVRSGIPLPASVVTLIECRAATWATMRLAAHGELVGPDDAVRMGLADQVVPVESLTDVAIVRAAELASLPAEPYATTKQLVNADLAEAMAQAV